MERLSCFWRVSGIMLTFSMTLRQGLQLTVMCWLGPAEGSGLAAPEEDRPQYVVGLNIPRRIEVIVDQLLKRGHPAGSHLRKSSAGTSPESSMRSGRRRCAPHQKHKQIRMVAGFAEVAETMDMVDAKPESPLTGNQVTSGFIQYNPRIWLSVNTAALLVRNPRSEQDF